MQIIQASTPEQIAEVRNLFQEFAAWLQVDLCFQGFNEELARLPGDYAPPRGRLLLVTAQGAIAGCAALRPFKETACEMKRLFVRPAYQGSGFGRALAQRLIADAKTIGYTRMLLDTLPFMDSAITLRGIRLPAALELLRRALERDGVYGVEIVRQKKQPRMSPFENQFIASTENDHIAAGNMLSLPGLNKDDLLVPKSGEHAVAGDHADSVVLSGYGRGDN